jgi:hypothetical protein
VDRACADRAHCHSSYAFSIHALFDHMVRSTVVRRAVGHAIAVRDRDRDRDPPEGEEQNTLTACAGRVLALSPNPAERPLPAA